MVLCTPLWLMFVLDEFLGRRSFKDLICCNFCMVLSMFFRLVLANSLFSLRDINLTLGLLPPRRHVVWRDSVGVRSSRSGLKSECADIFSRLRVVPFLRDSRASETRARMKITPREKRRQPPRVAFRLSLSRACLSRARL